MYGRIVLDIPAVEFDEPFETAKAAARREERRRGPGATTLAELCDEYKERGRAATGTPFPQDPMVQLRGADRSRVPQLERRSRHRLSGA